MPSSSSTASGKIREERTITTVRCGRERLNDEVLLNLVQIPAGKFMMGVPEDEEGYDPVDGPQHLVSVSEFWMGQYPVTQQEWRIVAGNYSKVKRDLEPNPSHFRGDRRPVERVSWNDAVEFCDRLSAHTNRIYRLPSEAEWEYACRAGTTTPFHFGPTLSAKYTNYRATEVYGPGEQGEYREETVDVDYFKVTNNFGLCDMHGNVREWCLDHWHETYTGAPVDGSAWIDDTMNKQSPSQEQRRVRRGGSWDFNPKRCRAAYRSSHAPDNRYYSVGFRVVLVPH